MNRRSFIKNICFLEIISLLVTGAALLFVVKNEYDSIVSSTYAKIYALEKPLMDGIELKQYGKIQSLLNIIKEPSIEGVMVNIPSERRTIHVGKIYPAEIIPKAFLVYKLRGPDGTSSELVVYGKWTDILFSVLRRTAPILIGVNLLVVVIIFCAQLPYLLHSKRLLELMSVLAGYDGTEEAKFALTKLSESSNDANILWAPLKTPSARQNLG